MKWCNWCGMKKKIIKVFKDYTYLECEHLEGRWK